MFKAAARDRPAADQQVLRVRPDAAEELRARGARPGCADLLRELAQSDPADATGASTLTSTALGEAVDAAREISGSPDLNVCGACSGGITLRAWLGYLAATRARECIPSPSPCACSTRPRSVRHRGPVRDPRHDQGRAGGVAQARGRGRNGPRAHVRVDAAQRLVWNTSSTTTCSATTRRRTTSCTGTTTRPGCRRGCTSDFLDLFKRQLAHRAGRARSPRQAGSTSRRSASTRTSSVARGSHHAVAGRLSHRAARGRPGHVRVVATAGHIQSLVNPPGNSSGRGSRTVRRRDDPEAGRGREKQRRSWWPYWRAWLRRARGRSGANRARQTRHPALAAAPARTSSKLAR